ncbi:MAG TPA: serine protease [Gemmata sp.]
MFRVAAGLALLGGLIVPTLSAAGRADKPTKVEIGKRGKTATAFVEGPDRGSGTAFCVHPSGLFVTNEHVVRGATGEVTLVLNPALTTERVLKAKVVRVDKATDLALLRVDGVKDLPSLQLGSSDGIAELADVVACGFPLGKALATDKKEYPAISVNAGSVTSLRLKGGELQFIQIDVAVTFGSSGGPVLDDNGKVIGVVVSGIGGGKAGLNQAIPVNQLDRFLKAPDIAFVPPAVSAAELSKPVEFKARVVSFVPNAPEPTLKLVLRAGEGEPREFPMKAANGVWAATAAPVSKSAGARVEVAARFGTSTITGTIDDGVLKVAGKPMRMSSVRKVELKAKPVVLLADGRTTVEGAVTGLGVTDVDVGGQKLKLDLSKATQLTFQGSAPGADAVTATVVATVAGKEVARAEARLTVRDASAAAAADPSSVVITAPALDADRVVKRLPDVFTDVVLGGAGRYLIFHLPKLKKLAVFDVNEARVTKYIPLTEDDITYAAGLDCIVIGLKKAGKLERWSLTTFELEKSAPPPFKEDIGGVVLGYGSNGPLVVNGYFLDLATFRQLPVLDNNKNERVWVPNGRPFASGDGSVFAAWKSNQSPVETSSFVREGDTVKRYEGGELMHAIPGPDGKAVYTAKGVVSRTLSRGDRDDATYGYCLPAVRGDYFLSLTTATGGKGGGFTVYLRGLKQAVAKLDKVEHGLSFDGWDRESFGPWKRVFFVPDAKVIVVLPVSNDQVVLHKFDAEQALEKSGLNYLLVTSQPPAEVNPGATFTYAIKVKSKSAKVAYQLDSGPRGMTVSADGVVTWAVPADAVGDQDVILTVKDAAGQEVFHTFTVRVRK